jgi:hypothetical protein
MASERASRRMFLGVAALLFAASAAVTIVWCTTMTAAGGVPMSGGSTMPMARMGMPGQGWPGAATSFLGMWVVMMVAMMLPSLVPALWRYRQAVGRAGGTRPGWLTAVVGVGYFSVWTLFGMIAYPLGVALAAIEMRQAALARAAPIAVGAVVVIAGLVQLSAWKARHLAVRARMCARGRPRHGLATRPAPRPTLQPLLRRPDGDPPGRRDHGASRDGCGRGRHHRRTSRTGRRARRASHRGPGRRVRVVSGRASSRGIVTYPHRTHRALAAGAAAGPCNGAVSIAGWPSASYHARSSHCPAAVPGARGHKQTVKPSPATG